MARNPFPTRKDWQAEKTKFGIPDKIIKTGDFGERMDKLRAAFDTLGGAKPDIHNSDDILRVLHDGEALAEEWLAKAQAVKPTAFKDKAKALDAVKTYRNQFKGTAIVVKSVLDPMASARSGINKTMTLYRNAKDRPADQKLLYKFWDDGMRQYVGQGLRSGLLKADQMGYSAAVKKQLKDYDDLVEKWMKTVQTGALLTALVKDPVRLKEFMVDMGNALGIATSVLAATAK